MIRYLQRLVTLLTFSLFFGELSIAANKSDAIYDLSLEELLNLSVYSASGISEKVSESPVPITIITEAMIANSAALSLRDLLSQYVPGFTQVQDQNEYNTAFRGVYSSSQQKILILLDGKRINSRSYSGADPAFGISLDKLSQIEVVRGPGSSIYGNVALTAVINLKLKTPTAESSGVSEVKIGNNGLKSLYSEWSSALDNQTYLAWLSVFSTEGEAFTVNPEDDYSPTPANVPITIKLDSFDARPGVDIGFSANGESWSSYLTYRQSHYIEPLSGGGLTGEAYDIRHYPHKGANAPGADFYWLNLDAEKRVELGSDSELSLNGYYAKSRVAGSFVVDPSMNQYGSIYWKEQTFGTNIKWNQSWESSALLLGLQYEENEVTESDFLVGIDSQIVARPFPPENPVLLLGTESVLSFYAEYRYDFDKNWLINIGSRYDDKQRLIDEDVRQTSPRLALIFQNDEFNFKLGYSRSFVDPPYWNRYAALASFRGSRELRPEVLKSYQFSPEWLLLEQSLSSKLNFFYNIHSDFVFRNREASADESLFANSGKMETYGLEHEWLYRRGAHSLRLVGTYQKVASVEFYDATDDEVFNIPKSQYSFSWDAKLSQSVSSQIYLQYLSSRISPIRIANNNVLELDPFPNQGVEFEQPNHRLPSVVLLHAKLRWRLSSMPIELSISAQNLLDKQWEQGGSTIHPYPQTGRWIQLGAKYKW